MSLLGGGGPKQFDEVPVLGVPSAERVAFVPRHGVGTQAVMLASATGIAQLIVAGMYIGAARSASPAQFGFVVAAVAIGNAAVGFLDFGTNALWVRELARGKLAQQRLGHAALSKLLIGLALGVLWVPLTFVLLPRSVYWIAAPIALALLANQTMQVSLRGIGRADLVAWSILTDRVIGGSVLTGLFLIGLPPFTTLWIALSAGSMGAALMAWKLTPQAARPIFRKFRFVNPWSGSHFYGLTGLATSAQSLDLAVMTAVGGPVIAGTYGAVNRWTQPLGLLVGAFSSASIPFVAQSSSWKDAWLHVRKGMWLPIAAILASIMVAAFSSPIVDVLIGPEYKNSASVLRILALATIPGIVNQPVSVFLQSMGLDRPVAIIMGANVIIVLVLIAVFVPIAGAIGAAIAALVTQTAVAIALVLVAVGSRKHGTSRKGRS